MTALVLALVLSQADAGVLVVGSTDAGLTVNGAVNLPFDAGVWTVAAFDAGVSFDESLYATCPAAPPSVPVVWTNAGGKDVLTTVPAVDAGFTGWLALPPMRSERLACLMETCESDRKARATAMNQTMPATWWQVGLTVLTTSGVAYSLGRLTSPLK